MDGWCNVSTNQENHGAVICNKVVKTYLVEILNTTTTTTTSTTYIYLYLSLNMSI
jgi:hypothetical protein